VGLAQGAGAAYVNGAPTGTEPGDEVLAGHAADAEGGGLPANGREGAAGAGRVGER
jgi:hypothetical protein